MITGTRFSVKYTFVNFKMEARRHLELNICRKYVRILLAWFIVNSRVNNKSPPGHQPTPEENQKEIIDEMVVNPRKSITNLMNGSQIFLSIVWRTLKRNKIYPNKIQMVLNGELNTTQSEEKNSAKLYPRLTDVLDTFTIFTLAIKCILMSIYKIVCTGVI